jgi:glycosyltransferase involved in cell wall biosynthesis
MADYPSITIVTPSYNQGEYIEQTIDSILSQNYPKLQYIIMDGGSTDATPEILRKFSKHIHYWESQKDRGQSHAINKGLAMANGTLFNWINSDDWMAPNSLVSIAEIYNAHQAEVILTRTNLVRQGQVIGVNGHTKINATAVESALERGLNQPGHFYKTEVLKRLNGVDECYQFSMDLDLWVRYLLTFGQEKTATSDTITTYFRFHPDSKSEIQGWDLGSGFDLESKAMRIRLARQLINPQPAIAFQKLYSDAAPHCLEKPAISIVHPENLSKWANSILYPEIQKAFYSENFNDAKTLAEGILSELLPLDAQKNVSAYKRYSAWTTHFPGSILHPIFKLFRHNLKRVRGR